MSSVLRSVKNVTKGYSSVQVKVRNATSNDPWGPTGTDMADIAKITYNSSTDFYEVMDMLDKRLNDKGKNWRHVLKSLKVLDYCLHEGSELVVTWARKNIYIIKTLREFMHTDEDGRDVGASIRASAKELTPLILDEERLRAERQNRGSWKSRVTGLEDFGLGGEPNQEQRRHQQRRNQRPDDDDDLEFRLALEASKNEADEAAKRQKPQNGEADDDLAKAIKLSQEEEELRKRQLQDQEQGDLLFDDTPAQQPQPTGFNQGYQQQAAVDWFGNPVQGQPTGYYDNAYSQPTGLQPQQTAFQNGYGYQQPQQTGYDQMQQPQQQFLQPQQTYNPWAHQMALDQQNQNQQQALQQQQTAQAGSNNPFGGFGQSQGTIGVQATGSNNPFAQQAPRAQTASPFGGKPTLDTLREQHATNQFTQSRPNPIQNFTSPVQQQPVQPQQTQQQQPPQDPYQAKLNALLASGEGQDTFGNTGDLRIPSQHTAPGTFVNSAGAGSMGRLEAAKTGNNPFYSQAPQQYPAQTGPAGGFGGNNPFGARPPQQQNNQGSLIDL
ncbi:Epsin-1 [Fulvia fulva]|nr:Epsin-1 [Fulvia fulva]KAK4625705.1 Epsin-1 [Fulvia fulva]WPV30243.1 Epsin-1 [Fulvia fulva]